MIPGPPLLGGKSSSDPSHLAERAARGFTAFELYGASDDIAGSRQVRDSAARILASGMDCYAVHSPRYFPDSDVQIIVGPVDRGWWPGATEGVLRSAELAAACGAGIVIVHAGDCQPVPPVSLDDHRAGFAAHLAELSYRVGREFPGVVLGVENVPPEALIAGVRFSRPLAYGDFGFTAWPPFGSLANVGCVLDVTHTLYAVEESRRRGNDVSYGDLVRRAAPTCCLVHLASPSGALLEEVGTVHLHGLPFRASCGLLRECLEPLRGFRVPFTLEVTLEDQADSEEMARTRDAVLAAWDGIEPSCRSCGTA